MKTLLTIIGILFCTVVTSQNIVVENGDTLVQFSTVQVRKINSIVIEHEYLSLENNNLIEQVTNLSEQISVCEKAKTDLTTIQSNNTKYIAELHNLHKSELDRCEVKNDKIRRQRNTWVGTSGVLALFLAMLLL